MSMLDTNHSGRRITRAVALVTAGLVATLGADVAVAATHGKTNAFAAKHAGVPAGYLHSLNRVDHEVYDAVGPVQTALDSIIDPNYEAIVGVRDSIVHGDSTRLMREASANVRSISAPSAFSAKQHSLVKAADALVTATTDFKKLDNATYNGLVNGLEGGYDSRMVQAEDDWDTAMAKIYAAAKAKAPTQVQEANYRRLPDSRGSWIFSADKTCTSVAVKLAGPLAVVDKMPNGITKAVKFNNLWHGALSSLDTGLTKIKRPHGSDALPVMLVRRFQVLGYAASLELKLNSAITDHSLSAFQDAAAELKAANASQHALAIALRSYGAVGCGNVIDTWAGHGRSTNGGTVVKSKSANQA